MARLLPLILLAVLVACQSFPTGDDPNGIEGMSAQALIDALRDAGLECSGPDDSLVGYTVACVETPNVAGVNASGTTIDELASVEIYVLEPDRPTLESMARAVVSIPYQGSDPDAAMTWINERLDVGDCVAPGNVDAVCTETFGAADISVVVEDSGNTFVRLNGVIPRPSEPESPTP